MKFLIIISIISIAILKISQAETFSQYAGHPDYPGMCYYKDNTYPPGDIQIELRCVRLICSPNSWISGHTCPDSNPELQDCFRGGPVSIKLPFPECCKRKYSCDNPDKTTYTVIDF